MPLGQPQAHYLKTVLRRQEGDFLRVFNGKDGEFRARIEALDKKSCLIVPAELIRPQPDPGPAFHLLFCPLKKDRLYFLVEKAVELGVTGLHPVLSERTEIRKINAGRIQAHIIEASEQCERLILPMLYPLTPLETALRDVPALCGGRLFAALERSELEGFGPDFQDGEGAACLIGPEGGWSEAEKNRFQNDPQVEIFSLGSGILRAETAALTCLALWCGFIS